MKAFLAFLACVSIVQGQPLAGCPLPDSAGLLTIVSQLRGGANIRLVDPPEYKCLAPSRTQGAYQYLSTVMNYTRNGLQERGQFDAACLDRRTWIGTSSRVLSNSSDPVLKAQLKTTCSQCVQPNASSPSLQNLDIATHCLPCPSSCIGLGQCYQFNGSVSCCNYLNYFNSDYSCVNQCPPRFLPSGDNICSTVVGFSLSSDVIYRSSSPYRVTIFFSAPLPPFSDTTVQIIGGAYNLTRSLPGNLDLYQQEVDIESDGIALEDPTVYTLTLVATSTTPLISGRLVDSVYYSPTLQLTVIDDDVVIIGFLSPTTTINWNIATVTIVSSTPIAKPLLLQLTSVVGINQSVVAQPGAVALAIQFPILLSYDNIVALEEGTDVSISVSLSTPNSFVVIGDESFFPVTKLIYTSNEEVTIGFAVSDIIASEGGGSVTITVLRSNTTLLQPISVFLNIGPSSRTNTVIKDEILTFNDSVSSIAVAILIVDDQVALEPDDTFNLTLTVVQPDPRVHLSPAYTTVTIKDDDVVYIAMATGHQVIADETLVFPICVNRSGAASIAQPLPFKIQITGVQANHSTVTTQLAGYFDPLMSSSVVCTNISSVGYEGGLVATLFAFNTSAVTLLMDAMTTVINFTSSDLVHSSVQPLVTSSVQPLVTSSVQPLVTSSVQPFVTSSVQPLVTSSVQPFVTSGVQPLVTSRVQPLVTSSVQPFVTSGVQPLVTNSIKPLVTSSVQPLVTSSVQPFVTSSVQPLVTSGVQPLVTSSVQPLVTSSVQPLVTSSVQPFVTSGVQPLVTSRVQPLVTSSVQPLVTNSIKPLVTNSIKPLVTNSIKPLVTNSIKPSSEQPLVTNSIKPLVTSSVQPLVTSSVQASGTNPTHSLERTQLIVPSITIKPSISQQTSQLVPSPALSNSARQSITVAALFPTSQPQPITPQLVNDTIVADPLFTVPLLQASSGEPVFLCYEVHGQPGHCYNLISDSCISVNALYVLQGSLNIIDTIGIRTVDDGGLCISIKVNLSTDCMPYVNGQPTPQYSGRGINVSKFRQKVRVSVTNCKVQPLVMWITCMAYSSYQTLQFVVTRGLNLSPTSHGLIGQFWSVPVVLQPYQDPLQTTSEEFQHYVVTINHPNAEPRSFVATQYSETWDRVHMSCYYAGSSQGGIEGPSRNSVIEGRYIDYEVSSLENTAFKYSKFNSTLCITSS